jgi:hypothetical protein
VARSFVVLFGAAALLLPIAIGAYPVPGEPVAVIGSPFRSEADQFEIVAAARADVIQSVASFVTVVRSDDPQLVAKLYAAGAIAVIRGSLLAGCVPSSSTLNPTLKENV